MKIVRHIFQLNLAPKEVVRSKQILALIMVPLFIFQMSSLNLFFVGVARAEDETPSVSAPPVSDKSESEDDENNSEGVNDEDNGEEEDQAASEESDSEEEDEEVIQQSNEEVSGEENAGDEMGDEEGVTGNETEDEEGNTEENPVVASETLTVQGSENSDNSGTQQVAESEEENAEEDVQEPKWERDGDKWTIGPVELGKTYKAPQNEDVIVTFTKLPDNPGNLSIEEMVLSEEQMEELGALSNKAYDITSDMKDGTFEYDLTLPKPSGASDVQIKYAEKESELDEAKTIDDVDVKNGKVEAEELDHFTIFIVVESVDMTVEGNLNGVHNVTVSPSENISVNIKVGLEWGTNWKSTGWQIGDGSWQCIDTPNHQDDIWGTEYFNETFIINAPSTLGKYDVRFRAYTGNSCNWNYDTFEIKKGIEVASFVPTRICHVNGNGTYESITPATRGSLMGHVGNQNGHDIIPPIPTYLPSGQNWDTTGQAIWNNNCVVPPQTGSITITKDVIPNDSSVWDFTISEMGGAHSTYNINDLGDGEFHTFNNLTPGTYNILETTNSDYTTKVTCGGTTLTHNAFMGTVVGGQDLACTFTNTKKEYCGNGTVDSGEQCDDGNSNNGDSCLNTCVAATCGDGFMNMLPSGLLEECDDANSVDNDACTNSCTLPICGDGIIQGSEECDLGSLNNNSWSYGQFGCSTSCTNISGPRCGDNNLDSNDGEACDDGNTADGDGCSATCQIEDTTPPSVPTGIYFKDTVNNRDVQCGGFTSARNFDVYWNANNDPDFDHYEYISFNADGSNGPTRTFTTPYFHASWWTVPREGTYGVQVRTVDKMGNKSDWSGGSQGIENSCTYTADWTAPVVALNGASPFSVEKGTAYTEPGATWTDNIDGSGDVSDISGTVDTNTVGDYTITYSKTDRAGNTGSATRTVQVRDTTPPNKPTLIAPANNSIVQGASLTNSWSSVDGAVKYIYESYHNSSATILRWHEEFATTSKTANNVADTVFWWRVKAVDAAGNESEWSDLWKVTVDNTAPTIPELTWPINGISINNNAPLMQWNDSTDDNGVAGYYYRVYYHCSDENNIPGSCSSVYPNTDGLWRINSEYQAGATSDGIYYWQVRAKDNAEKYSDWSGIEKVIIDTQSPDVPTLIAPADGAIVNGNPTQSWNPVSDADHYVYESYSDINGNNLIYHTDVSGTSRTVGGTQTIIFYWRVKAVDAAGNESGWSEMRELTVDNTVPVITNVAADKEYVKAGDIVTINAEVTDNTGISAVSVDFSYNFGYTDRPSPTSVTMNKTSDNTYQVAYTVPAFWNDGVMYIKVAARDLTGGNWVRSSEYDQVTVDNVVPNSTIIYPVPESGETVVYSNNWEGSVEVSASDDRSGVAGVELSIRKDGQYYWNGTDWNSTTEEFVSTSWNTSSWVYSLTLFDEGTYVVRSHAIDNAGNRENTDEVTIIFDKTIPQVSLSVDPSKPDGDNNWYISTPEITLKAADSNFDRIEYEIDSGGWITYSYPVKIDDGKHVFRYRAWDKAGNKTDTGIKNIKVDTEDPDKVRDLDAEYDDDNSVKLTWNADDDDIEKVYIYRGGSKGFHANSGSLIGKNDDKDESFTDDDVERGKKYYYKLVSRDEAGNNSGARVISVEIPEEGGEAIVTDEGVDNSMQGSNPEEQSGNSEQQQNEEIQGGNGDEEGTILGEETRKESGNARRNFWIILLAALLGMIFFLLYKRRKNRFQN